MEGGGIKGEKVEGCYGIAGREDVAPRRRRLGALGFGVQGKVKEGVKARGRVGKPGPDQKLVPEGEEGEPEESKEVVGYRTVGRQRISGTWLWIPSGTNT